ncbi:hypothetical protein L1887_23277 [Cichorium endivia]|nr:hypothetical protein L1887_23277 [Cichorium endivia]
MKLQVSGSIILAIVLLSMVDMSSCRNLVDRSTNSKNEERIRANFVATFERHFHTKPAFKNLDNNQDAFTVSRRLSRYTRVFIYPLFVALLAFSFSNLKIDYTSLFFSGAQLKELPQFDRWLFCQFPVTDRRTGPDQTTSGVYEMSPVKSPQELSTPDVGKKDKIVVEKGEEESLPPGWTTEVRTRKGSNGIKRDRYYTDPVTGYVFRSLVDVHRYLKTGALGRLAKKPKNTETDKKIVEVNESKDFQENKDVSSPASEISRNKRPLEDVSPVTKTKSELPQRASRRLAGITIDAPPSSPPEGKTRLAAPPPTPLVPKTRHAKRQAGIEIEAPVTTPPPPPPPPPPHKATQLTGIKVEPPPPPPLPSSPPETKTSHQDEKEPQTRPPVVLAIQKKTKAEKITNNNGNADVAAKPPVIQENLEKIDKHQDLSPETPATLPPVTQPQPQPPSTIAPPVESAIPTADSRHEKQELPVTNPTQESSINFCLNDFWTDPCIEFAVKTLTGAIPFGDLNKVDNFSSSSPLEVPMEELWTDPCIEFAVKTLTGAIPVEDPGIQDYLHHQSSTASTSDMGMKFCQSEVLSKRFETGSNKKLDSVGNGGLQKSGNIGFHQQVNGGNGQSRQRFF